MSNTTMTKEEATKFFSTFYGGEHHFPGKMKEWGDGWTINHYGDLSTFDFNAITRLVVMAHDLCIRVSVLPCNMNTVRICIWKREREGGMMIRHPHLEEHVNLIREKLQTAHP